MNILTFDIEEWFHILDNESTKTAKEWELYEPRIIENMQRIFDLLDKHQQKATFFCMGWIAEKYPNIIKEIDARGFEIGSHTHMHQLIYEQSPEEFKLDLEKSINAIGGITGKKVRVFRAPGFSIKEENIWAFKIMAGLGIEVDCSVFPAARSHGGLPNFTSATPVIIEMEGVQLKEFPINTFPIFGKEVIFSGGGYFRLFPYFILKRFTQQSDYVMSYLHPRDFDAGQPMIKELSLIRRFKSYVGLKSALGKLDKWLTDFEFIDLDTAEKRVDWSQVPVVTLATSKDINENVE